MNTVLPSLLFFAIVFSVSGQFGYYGHPYGGYGYGFHRPFYGPYGGHGPYGGYGPYGGHGPYGGYAPYGGYGRPFYGGQQAYHPIEGAVKGAIAGAVLGGLSGR